MNWPTVVFACFSLFVIAAFAAFMIVYLKEYKREDNAIKEIMKLRDQQVKAEKEHQPIMYVVSPPAPPKKKVPAPPAPNKKNIN